MILALLEMGATITRRDVEEALQLSHASAGRLLRQMAEKGLLIQKGNGKTTYYEILMQN